MIGYAAFLKGAFKILRHIVFYTHGRKYDSKFFIGIVSQGRLTHDLRGQLVMGKSVSGKNRKLLSADQRGKAVNCGDPGPDIVSWIFPSHRIQRLAVYIRLFFRHDLAQVIDGLPDAVEGSSQ